MDDTWPTWTLIVWDDNDLSADFDDLEEAEAEAERLIQEGHRVSVVWPGDPIPSSAP